MNVSTDNPSQNTMTQFPPPGYPPSSSTQQSYPQGPSMGAPTSTDPRGGYSAAQTNISGYPPQSMPPIGASPAGNYPPQQTIPGQSVYGTGPSFGVSAPSYLPSQSLPPGFPSQNTTSNAGSRNGVLGYALAGLAGAAVGGAAGYAAGSNHTQPVPVNPMSTNYAAQAPMSPTYGAMPAPSGPTTPTYPGMPGYPSQAGYTTPSSAGYGAYPGSCTVMYPTTYPVYQGSAYPSFPLSMFPIQWTRPAYSYPVGYSPCAAFVMPVGLPSHLEVKMMQASAAFRMFDTNCSGSLSKKEWKRALHYLGFPVPKHHSKQIFHSIDVNRSGGISEREFCEWWISAFPY